MLKIVLGACAASLLIASVAGPASAGIKKNGVELNGIKKNGSEQNGRGWQGIVRGAGEFAIDGIVLPTGLR